MDGAARPAYGGAVPPASRRRTREIIMHEVGLNAMPLKVDKIEETGHEKDVWRITMTDRTIVTLKKANLALARALRRKAVARVMAWDAVIGREERRLRAQDDGPQYEDPS